MPKTSDKRCSRCYQYEGLATFTGDNKQCDKCVYEREVLNATSRRAQANSTHYDMIKEQAPHGDPIKYAAARANCDEDILREMVEAHRVVCEHRDARLGAFHGETPHDVALKHLGSTEDCDDRTAHDKLIVRYLSASVDAALWLGWFVPQTRKR